MYVLIGIALKSLIIAGVTLGLLALMKRRSAAERSWIAHIGLFALVTLALAPLVMPSWTIETAALGQAAPVHAIQAATPVAGVPVEPIKSTLPAATAPAAAPKVLMSPVTAATALYAVPAAILLLITLHALLRLVTLRARADVLVDGHWLSALARAQRRMGFKHGTALLTSNELASPISWGLMRPVILLNTRAVEAQGEAEAIIAHELAHVARMDWIKLLLARVATALFWFNPLVWILAREAHQLREEAADDSVLAADIVDTDYAQLLVGVARHECPGLLLGAHGVAPSKGSLSRRVARVLDAASVRGPAARSFAAGVFVGAVAIAAPLAALTLTPKGSAENAKIAAAARAQPGASHEAPSQYYPPNDVPTDLPSIISDGVAASVQSAVAAINPGVTVDPDDGDFETVSSSGASVSKKNGLMIARSPSGATVTIYPVDSQGRRKMVSRAASGATSMTFIGANDELPGYFRFDSKHQKAIEKAMKLKGANVTPDYVLAMSSVAPSLKGLDVSDYASMKAVGVTPEFAHDLVVAGFRDIDSDELVQARALGLTGGYVRSLRALGVRGEMDDFVQLRALGVTPQFVARARNAGVNVSDVDELSELITVGRSTPPPPPRPPAPPGS
jgi:beta-lactamase regulating signal transducer with metallopeptidase domain